MACDYVRKYYGVPAEIGRIIIFKGRKGIIVEGRGNYIGVNFDADKPSVICNVHPKDVEYKGIGKIRKMNDKQIVIYDCDYLDIPFQDMPAKGHLMVCLDPQKRIQPDTWAVLITTCDNGELSPAQALGLFWDKEEAIFYAKALSVRDKNIVLERGK